MISPPRPTAPRFLRMLRLIFTPIDYLDEYGKQFGDFFAVGSEDYPFVYVNNPKAIQEIFTGDPDLFESGRANEVLAFLLGENSLVLLDGAPHQRQRKLLLPPFHGEKLRNYGDIIWEIANQVINSWEVNKTIKVRPFMQEITLKVILQTVFGLQTGSRYDEIRQLLTSLLDSIGSPLTSSVLFYPALRKDWGKFSPWGRFLRCKQRVNELLGEEIKERRQENNLDRQDILSLLLAATDEYGQPMSDDEIRDELVTLLVAGHETTASALSWALYWVYFLPEVKEKLSVELSNLGENPSPSDMVRLPYLSAICSETLRIYPIVLTTFPRILKKPLDLMGYHFRPGTVLNPCVYLVHRREDIYPEADKFKPERFINRQYGVYEYFPFGGGNRKCIGMSLATMEMKLTLGAIVSRCQLALTSDRPLKPVRRGFTVAPPANFQLRVTGLRNGFTTTVNS